MKRIDRSGGGRRVYRGEHRLEHWYIDNQVYFITARCRDGYPAFDSDRAKRVFWDRFEHYAQRHGFTPWVTSLLNNHYHALGYLRVGKELGGMMQRLHGSVAKMVNDGLEADGLPRRARFWKQSANHDYFDGAIRSEKQARLAYRYTLRQGQRHGVVGPGDVYAHTKVGVALEPAIRRSLELGAFLEGVPYKRYAQRMGGGGGGD
ncbi:MAG: transposase [Phycisphaeraceae bacterium]